MKQKLTQKTKKEVVADRFTTNVEIEFGGDLFPRPLFVSGSPFLPPLSKRASLLKVRFSGPPWEAPKILCFVVFFYFFDFKGKYIVSWKFKDFPKTPRRYTNFLEKENLKLNENFLRASRGKKR